MLFEDVRHKKMNVKHHKTQIHTFQYLYLDVINKLIYSNVSISDFVNFVMQFLLNDLELSDRKTAMLTLYIRIMLSYKKY